MKLKTNQLVSSKIKTSRLFRVILINKLFGSCVTPGKERHCQTQPTYWFVILSNVHLFRCKNPDFLKWKQLMSPLQPSRFAIKKRHTIRIEASYRNIETLDWPRLKMSRFHYLIKPYILLKLRTYGGTRMLKIREMLAEFFGTDQIIRKNVNVDEAVVRGAAIRSAMLQQNAALQGTVLRDVIPLTLGIKTTSRQRRSNCPNNWRTRKRWILTGWARWRANWMRYSSGW